MIFLDPNLALWAGLNFEIVKGLEYVLGRRIPCLSRDLDLKRLFSSLGKAGVGSLKFDFKSCFKLDLSVFNLHIQIRFLIWINIFSFKDI